MGIAVQSDGTLAVAISDEAHDSALAQSGRSCPRFLFTTYGTDQRRTTGFAASPSRAGGLIDGPPTPTRQLTIAQRRPAGRALAQPPTSRTDMQTHLDATRALAPDRAVPGAGHDDVQDERLVELRHAAGRADAEGLIFPSPGGHGPRGVLEKFRCLPACADMTAQTGQFRFKTRDRQTSDNKSARTLHSQRDPELNLMFTRCTSPLHSAARAFGFANAYAKCVGVETSGQRGVGPQADRACCSTASWTPWRRPRGAMRQRQNRGQRQGHRPRRRASSKKGSRPA